LTPLEITPMWLKVPAAAHLLSQDQHREIGREMAHDDHTRHQQLPSMEPGCSRW
jgi:hypothetical protein